MIRKAALLVLAVALVAAGAAAAVSDRHPRDPRESFTAGDRAWAKRIALTRADLPGWRSSAPTGGEDPRCPGFDPDQSDLTLTGKADSRDYERGTTLVSSSVQIFRTAGEAASSFRRGAKPEQLVRCYDVLFREEIEPEGTARLVTGRAFPAPRVGDRRLAIGLVWRVTVEGQTVRVYTDVIGWDRGRASTGLAVVSIGTPPDRALEARLARRLDARMRP